MQEQWCGERVLRALDEYHRLVLVNQDAVFQVPAHGPGEHDLLQVAALAHHVLNRIAIGNAHQVLLDDRTLIQTRGDIVAGGAEPGCSG